MAVDSVSSPAYHADYPKVVLYGRKMNVNRYRGSSAGLDEEGHMIARTLADKKRLASVFRGIRAPRALCFLLPLAMLAGCATSPRGILDVHGISYAPLHKKPEHGILVITEQGRGSTWFMTRDSRIYLISDVPRLKSGANAWKIVASPDDKYIAADVEGEGHHNVEVFCLPLKTYYLYNGDLHHVDPVAYVHPHPGDAFIVGWKDEVTLEIRCDRPLHRSTPDDRGVSDPYEYLMEHFLWDIPTDTIRRK